MGGTPHTIKLLERKAPPIGTAYTRRLCDDGCGKEAMYVADQYWAELTRFLCTDAAIDFCKEYALRLPQVAGQRP